MISQVFTLLITIVITNSSYNNGHTFQHQRHLPIQHTPLSWVDWKKISPTMRQHSSKQMYTKLLLRHNKSKTLAHIEFIPLASPAESSKIRATCAARLSNVFHLFYCLYCWLLRELLAASLILANKRFIPPTPRASRDIAKL